MQSCKIVCPGHLISVLSNLTRFVAVIWPTGPHSAVIRLEGYIQPPRP